MWRSKFWYTNTREKKSFIIHTIRNDSDYSRVETTKEKRNAKSKQKRKEIQASSKQLFLFVLFMLLNVVW